MLSVQGGLSLLTDGHMNSVYPFISSRPFGLLETLRMTQQELLLRKHFFGGAVYNVTIANEAEMLQYTHFSKEEPETGGEDSCIFDSCGPPTALRAGAGLKLCEAPGSSWLWISSGLVIEATWGVKDLLCKSPFPLKVNK